MALRYDPRMSMFNDSVIFKPLWSDFGVLGISDISGSKVRLKIRLWYLYFIQI